MQKQHTHSQKAKVPSKGCVVGFLALFSGGSSCWTLGRGAGIVDSIPFHFPTEEGSYVKYHTISPTTWSGRDSLGVGIPHWGQPVRDHGHLKSLKKTQEKTVADGKRYKQCSYDIFHAFFHVYVSHVYVSWVIWMWDESHIPFWPYSSPCSPNKQWSQWSLRKLVPLIRWWTFHAYLHFTRLCFDAPKPPTKNISQTQRTHRCAVLPFRGGKNWRLPRQVDELDQRFARIFLLNTVSRCAKCKEYLPRMSTCHH